MNANQVYALKIKINEKLHWFRLEKEIKNCKT